MSESSVGARRTPGPWMPFLAGVLAGGLSALLLQSLLPRRRLDRRLIARLGPHRDLDPTVIVPGLLGSELRRPDGTRAWLNLGNAFGYHDLGLPLTVPLAESRDDLVPGGLVGVDEVLPRLFGFTEYSDLIDLLGAAGFRRGGAPELPGPVHHVFTYDWRRDLVESARALGATLEALAGERGGEKARFNLVGHSMGGLVARYYLRYGTAEPREGAPVTWAGARRIRSLVLVATPSGGSISALEAILYGDRVGLSSTTLAPWVIARMPSVYQLLPPEGAASLLDERGAPLAVDLHDVATWTRFGWGPFASPRVLEAGPGSEAKDHKAFVAEALLRARAVHRALSAPPATECPTRVVILGGDCLPTLGRAVVPERKGRRPRFQPRTRAESEAMFEAGDGRVTRASVLASHLPGADESEGATGIPEVTDSFFGSAEHHGIYADPAFQSLLLRILLRPVRRAEAAAV